MNKNYVLLAAMLLSTSCASIVGKSQYPVVISSTPSDAKFTVLNENGVEIASGKTPNIVTLKSGKSYFKKNFYIIKYQKNGYEDKVQTLEPSINPWYWGNVLIGGLVGFLIVDPITGAMYKLPENVNSYLQSN